MRYLIPLVAVLGLSGVLLASYLAGTAPEPLEANTEIEAGASLIAPEPIADPLVALVDPASPAELNPFAADSGGFIESTSAASSAPLGALAGGMGALGGGMGMGLTEEHAAIMAGTAPGPEVAADTTHVSFEGLSVPDYEGEPYYDDEEEQRRDEDIFPPALLALDGQKVALDGFMNPLDFEGRDVVSFLLSPYPPGCCFTGMPRYDELVDAYSTEGETFQWYPYRALRVTGTLRVGEQLDEYGYVLSIYRLEVEKIEPLW